MRQDLKIDARLIHLTDALGTEIFHTFHQWRRRTHRMMPGIERIVPVGIEIVFFQSNDHSVSWLHCVRTDETKFDKRRQAIRPAALRVYQPPEQASPDGIAIKRGNEFAVDIARNRPALIDKGGIEINACRAGAEHRQNIGGAADSTIAFDRNAAAREFGRTLHIGERGIEDGTPVQGSDARAQPRFGKPMAATDLQAAYLGFNTQFDKFGEAVMRLGGIVGHPHDDRCRVSIDAVEDAAQHADFIESLAGLQHIWAHQTDLDGIHMRPHLKNTRRNRLRRESADIGDNRHRLDRAVLQPVHGVSAALARHAHGIGDRLLVPISDQSRKRISIARLGHYRADADETEAKAGHESSRSPFLSKPAARPTGLEISMPAKVVARRGSDTLRPHAADSTCQGNGQRNAAFPRSWLWSADRANSAGASTLR